VPRQISKPKKKANIKKQSPAKKAVSKAKRSPKKKAPKSPSAKKKPTSKKRVLTKTKKTAKKTIKETPAPRKKTASKTSAAKTSKSKSTAPKRKNATTKKIAKKPASRIAKKTAKKTTKKASEKATLTKARTSAPGRIPASKKTSPPPMRVSVQWGSERIELVEEGTRVPKTKLKKKDLREFERLLLEKRKELVGDMQHLSTDAHSSHQASSGSSSVPLHMADVGSDNWEQEFTLGLIENERALVREIDDALERIENRTYGVCLATHRPINIARLRAKPWAKYCIEYAQLRELGRVP
jgi:RNA polymerase-binding transcription factor